jgi:hypothetical protein
MKRDIVDIVPIELTDEEMAAVEKAFAEGSSKTAAIVSNGDGMFSLVVEGETN